MQIQISRCLDLRYKTKNNNYPLCIKLYQNRKYDYVPTGIYLTKEEYNRLHSSKVSPLFKDYLKIVHQIESLIRDYLNGRPYNIKAIRAFLKDDVAKEVIVSIEPEKEPDDVLYWFSVKIAILDNNKQIGNAECYTSTRNVLKQYLKISSISFSFFTVDKLKELETSMMNDLEITLATIGKHARNLRAVFNLAIEKKAIPLDLYPFGRYKYVLPEVTKSKKSLSRKVLAELIKYVPETYHEKRAIAYFIFSYYGNGMNLKDMAHLKYRDLNGFILSFYRKKTRNTNKQLKMIRIIITDEMRNIIQQFGNLGDHPNTYIFPIINDKMDIKTMDAKVHTRNRSINNTLQVICRKLGFSKHITLGMARHTFANALKQEGANIAFIQESLGHGSSITTEHYLNSFEDEITSEHIQKLKDYYLK